MALLQVAVHGAIHSAATRTTGVRLRDRLRGGVHAIRRDVVDEILCVVCTGCSWRHLPVDFPPWQTVYWYFSRWEEAKVTEQVMAVLRRRVRTAQGRGGEPSAGILDSQSTKGADTVGRPTRGHNAGKKVNGRKRFILTDTLGLVVCVMAASVQGRDHLVEPVPGHAGAVRVR